MKPQAIAKFISEHFRPEIDDDTWSLIGAANEDLYYGYTPSEGYPGFEAACRIIKAALRGVGDVWIDVETDYVMTNKPAFCDGCDDEECSGMLSEDVIYVERSEVIQHLVGRELAPYVR